MNGPHQARVFVALDTPDVLRARELANALQGKVAGFKVGLELFITAGPDLIRELRDAGHRVFLDLKLHDIPNTVAGAAAAVGRLGAEFFTMHAVGGTEMLRRGTDAAADAAAQAGHRAPTSLAVTVLTSHDDAGLESIGLAGPCAPAVDRLAGLANQAGIGGAVCSPLEVRRLRNLLPGRILMVPGIRPAGLDVRGDDQARTATPAGAITDGADYLVIGRPITRADHPAAAAEQIAAELASAGV